MRKFYLLLSAIVLIMVSLSNVEGQNINGYLWQDDNGNGIQDGGEAPIDGVTVELLDQFGVGTGITDVTGSVNPGEYSLAGATPGVTYGIEFGNVTGVDPGYVPTAFQQGGDNTIDSDCDQISFRAPNFVMPGVDLDDMDAGFYVTVSVGDLVWLDDNGNGIDDDGPIALPSGVDVTLYKEDPLGSGTFVVATDYLGLALPANPINTTDNYLFDLISPGNYYVEFADGSAGLMYHTYEDYSGGTDQATDVGDDSDARRADGQSHQFELFSGDPLYDQVDAGYFQAYSIEGYVWEDANGNGIDDDGSGATPVPVNVTLEVESPLGSGNWITATDEYNSPGTLTNPVNTSTTYSFLNIPPGNYRVLFEEPGDAAPADMHLTEQNAGGDGGVDVGDDVNDSDPDRIAVGGNGITHEILCTSARGGTMVTNVNAGYFLPVRIGDFVFEDLMGEGDQTGDPGLADPVDISLFRMDLGDVPALDVDGNPYVVPINQNGAGIYEFFPLPPGEYQVQFDWVEPDLFPTYMDAVADDIDSDIMDCVAGGAPGTSRTPSTAFLNSDDEDLTLDAGFFKPGRISDFVWEDLNGNGRQDGEPGIGGVQVEILEAGTMGPVDYADCTPTAGSVVTDGAGMYEFINLRPGNYVIQFFAPAAPDQYYFTLVDAVGAPGTFVGDDATDSDADPATGLTFDIPIVSDDDIDIIDCGMLRGASIGDFCWHDENGNGIQDGEPPLAGVTISIVDVNTGLEPNDLATMAPVGNRVSDGAGFYEFDNLPPGEYQLTFTEPAPDWYLTRVNQSGGATDATDTPDDSDPDELNGNTTHTIELESNEMEEDIDAGFFRVASLGDLVFHDANANGVFDDAVGALPAGITVTVVDLITGDDPALDIMGNPAVVAIPAGGLSAMYNFTGPTGLKPGEYDVRLDVPGGWFVTDLGGDNVFDPGTGTVSTAPITLLSDQMNNDIDGGVYANVTVGGIVWGDADGNCTFDAGTEMGFPNDVVLVLVDANGVEVAMTNTDNMGMYMFMDVKPGDYTILIPAGNFDNTAPLYNLIPCGPANDPNSDTPNDNNGDGAAGGPVVTPNIELLCGDEPGGGGLENKTIDFGFEFDCDATNNPYAWLTCTEAAMNPICNVIEFEQGCGTMPNIANPVGPNPLCPGGGGVPHNTSWFSFIAGYGDYDIEIALNGCNPGTGGSTGIQSGLYLYDPNNANCWGNEAPYCEDACVGGDIVLDGAALIPGQQYLMFLDGCNGSWCGYEINILGNYEPFIVNDAEAVLCNGDPDCGRICPGTTITFEAQDLELTYDEITNLIFGWSFRDEFGNVIDNMDWVNDPTNWEVTENEITLTFDDVGTYQVCLDQIRDICDNVVIADICQTIEVFVLEDEDFGTVEVCEGLISVYQGPTSVNDEGIITDPNGDDLEGWQATTFFQPGINTANITTSLGCMYEQTVEIVPILNGLNGLLDTAVCGEDNFPVDVLNASLTSEIEGFAYYGFGEARNGCDTSMTINVYNLEIDGEVELVGCAPNGFEIQFVESAISNSQEFPVTYEWFDEMDNPIADNDAEEKTIVVPAAGNYCVVITMSSEFFIPDQDEIMCPYEFCFDLNTDNFLPEAPEKDNWDLEFCEYDNTFTYVAETDDDPNEITFNWTYPGDVASATGADTDSLTIDWTGSIGGEVCVTITNACGTSEPVCDTVIIIPTPVASIAPLDSICVDSTTSIMYPGTADPTFSYAWNFGGGTPTGSTNVPGPIDVAWGEPGIKTVGLTITKSGCVSSAAMTDILVVEPVNPPTITCTSSIDEVIFTWNDPSGYVNYFPDITTVIEGDGGTLVGNEFTIGGLNVGDSVAIQLVTTTTSPCGDLISIGSCKAQDCPTNVVTPEPVADICVDPTTQPFDLTATLQNPINGDYNWTGTAITDNAAGTFDPQLATTGANMISVTFIDENLCEYSSSLTIDVNPTPTSDFITDKIVVCQDSTVNVEYNGSITTGGTYNWDFEDVLAPGNGPGPFDVQWSTPGDKEITLSVSKAGCPSEETLIPVTVEPRIEPLVIDCDESATSITFNWNDLDNVSGYDIYIDNMLVSSNTTDLDYGLSSLVPGTTAFVEIIANSDNSCAGVSDTLTCTAENCPPIDIVFNVSDTTLCLDATAVPFQLVANVSGGPGLGGEVEMWDGPGVDPNTGVFDPAAAGVSGPGGHTITYTYTEANCDETATLRITLINQPTSDFTAPPVICVTDNLELTYTGTAPNLPFEWDVEDGADPTGVGPSTYVTNWTDAGTYDISLQVGQGTCLSDLTTIQVQVDPEMDTVDIDCSSTLNSVTFTWDDIDCATEYQVSIDGSIVGTQTDLMFPVTGLAEGDMVEIEILPIEECECPAMPTILECEARACPPVQLDLTTPVDEYCEGDLSAVINLQVNVEGSETPGTGTWSGDGGVTAAGEFDPSTQAPGLYTFTYSYSESGCDFDESISIQVNENPTVEALPTDPICYQDNFGSVQVNPAGGTGTNYTIELDGSVATGDDLAEINPGNHNITVTDEAGCDVETSFTILDAIAAQIEIQGLRLIKAGDEGTLVADITSIDGPVDSLIWTNSQGEVICSGTLEECEEILISPEDTETYTVVIYYNEECTVEESVIINVANVDVIILPNVITPGSTVTGGNGEFFIPEYPTIVQVKSLLIYDRWGNKMFKSEDTPTGPGFGWNGSMNGRSVAQGVYVYTVDLLMETGEILKLSGDITVLAPK